MERGGGRGRDRTYDQSIKSRMLYQLSYASFGFCSWREEVAVRAFAMVSNGKTAITRLIKDNTACSVRVTLQAVSLARKRGESADKIDFGAVRE